MKFVITGQTPSGKNSVIVTRTGKRFPSKRFKEWRDKALAELKSQNRPPKPILKPVNVSIWYWAGDNRRRDIPGILDALWHLLEKAKIIADDTFLGGHHTTTQFFNQGKHGQPRVEIEVYV